MQVTEGQGTYHGGPSTSGRWVVGSEPRGSTLSRQPELAPHTCTRGKGDVSPSRRSCQVMPGMGVAEEDVMMVVRVMVVAVKSDDLCCVGDGERMVMGLWSPTSGGYYVAKLRARGGRYCSLL